MPLMGAGRRDRLDVVVDDVVNAVARDLVRILPRLLDGGRVAWPAGRGGRVTLFLEEIHPGAPGVGVEPEPVDEDDGGAGGCGHDVSLGEGARTLHAARGGRCRERAPKHPLEWPRDTVEVERVEDQHTVLELPVPEKTVELCLDRRLPMRGLLLVGAKRA